MDKMSSMTCEAANRKDKIERDGFCVIAPWMDVSVLANFRDICEGLIQQSAKAGTRSPYAHSVELRTLINSSGVSALVGDVLGADAFVARSILFDKRAAANWAVTWHQDTTIAVQERRDVVGFGPWSVKEGIPHVRPPAYVLESMIAVRIHLDDCDRENGALYVVPGSHKLGIMQEASIAKHVEHGPIEICEVPAGGIMLMRPLLLHASKKSVHLGRRRVLHLEFAQDALPDDLKWATS